ncbi:hypothetical protein J3R82DRAFT_3904 [Butyriboletus roseoflavus]|nr:hypothetical protein J3R82DRAFT_3904 [Butyriboletus roseoflavus]
MLFKTLSMSQTEPPVLSSNFEHITRDEDIHKSTTSPSQVLVPDLPSWTPLSALGDAGGPPGSDPLADVNDGPSILKKATGSAMKQLGELPANAQATMTTGQTLKSSSESKPSKAKRARFDGILITTKPLPGQYKQYRSQTQSRPASASSARVLSLVDALARTFDANRHTEEISPRRSRTLASRQPDDASSAPQTDAESTEAEDERFRLNTRLIRTPLKRWHTQVKTANASETNSEDIPPPERLVKQLKPIQYEANPELIDTALGTVHAPISWDAEMDIIVRGEDYVIPAQIGRFPEPEDVRMTVDEGDRTAGSPGKGCALPSTLVGNEWHMPTLGNPGKSVLTPYLSRGAKFRQRLGAIFGENATVRTDRIARPRRADHDLFVPFGELDRELTPDASESTASVISASAAEEGASAIPSTHITSQSPDIPPADTSMDLLPGNQLNDVDSPTKPTFDADDEEQMSGWITALQRLVKGKVRVKEEDLEILSVILAEIESVKDSLDESISMIPELRESVKQLSELFEIPFGDRNKLRQRAEDIFRTWPSIEKRGAS